MEKPTDAQECLLWPRCLSLLFFLSFSFCSRVPTEIFHSDGDDAGDLLWQHWRFPKEFLRIFHSIATGSDSKTGKKFEKPYRYINRGFSPVPVLSRDEQQFRFLTNGYFGS